MPRLNQRVATLNDVHPLDCPVAIQVRTDYANWLWAYSHGYIYYSQGNTKLLEHRLVCKRSTEVDISGLHIHHLNENILDNRAGNLEALTAADHARLHKGTERILIPCALCGAEIPKTQGRASRRSAHFCNDECRTLHSRRAERPPAHDLLSLMIQVNNWRSIGQMFGVSDNAVRKWAKQYNLDLSVCNGRKKSSTPTRI